MKPLILKGHTRPLTCVKYNREGDLLFSSAKDKFPTVWFTDTGERLGTLTENGHKGTVWSIDVDKDSLLVLTGGADCAVKLWYVKTGTCLQTWELSSPVRVVEFSEKCDSFLCVVDPFIKKPSRLMIYGLKKFPRTEKALDEYVARMNKSIPDYDKANEQPIAEWTLEGISLNDKIYVASWTALDQHIVTGDTIGSLRLHNPTSGKVLKRLEAHVGKINSLQWNKSKTLFITGGADMRSYLVELKTFKAIKTYESNTPVNAAAISPIKEHVLVAGGQDAMNVTTTSSRVGKFETKFFHLVFQEEWGSVKGHFGPVNTLAIHPDGIGFVSGSEDGYIRLHKFNKEYFTKHSEFDDLTALENIAKEV